MGEIPETNVPQASPSSLAPRGRVVSIDALRGFDMLWIIGGWHVVMAFKPLPAWLEYHFSHPKWVGFSAWDMIMPLFLFVVGAAMPFSFARRRDKGHSTGEIYGKVLVRFVVLFVLGMIAQGKLLEFNLKTLHIYTNTLQAIACGYLVAAVLLLHFSTCWQVATTAALLLGYWALLMWVPVPGEKAGLLLPQTNLAICVDRAILGQFMDDDTTYTWILSSMGFAATVMFGLFAGKLLRSGLTPWAKVAWLVIIGLLCLSAGLLWSLRFPFIKHIWTSSMVLWAAGWSYLLLAAFYAVIDVLGYRRWTFPLVVIGSNAIFVYMATRVIDFKHVSHPIFGGLARHCGDYEKPVLAAATLLVIWLMLWYMYRKRTFLKV